MAHRLLHTLVVSSSLLLEGALVGCGGGGEPAHAAEPAASSGGSSTSTASAGGTSSETSSGTPVAIAELAPCRGWPTTKGAHYEVDASGVSMLCGMHSEGGDGGPSCCPSEPAAVDAAAP